MVTDAAEVTDALAQVVAALPSGGEARAGQALMAEAVAHAIETGRHLAVQAGTGTGKTLAYLVPAVLSGRRTIVATATKALQDQLAKKDLPFLDMALTRSFSWAVLKGRANYVCLQRIAELASNDVQLGLDGLAERAPAEELAALAAWAADTTTGDRSDLDVEPSERAWAAVSTSSRECPGAVRCPRGGECFAERARADAADADIVVTNLHLYGLDLATGGSVLPDHDLVVIDEAHQLEDVISATAGVELSGGRLVSLARMVKGVVAEDALVSDVDGAAAVLAEALRPRRNRRLTGALEADLEQALATVRGRVERAMSALRAVPDDAGEDVRARTTRATRAATSLVEDLDAVSHATGTDVVWVEGPDHALVLRVAPVDVAPLLHETLWQKHSSILTSATIPRRFARRVGLPNDRTDELDVGSPFDFETNALLYCATHLPDPRRVEFQTAMIDELTALIDAARGRTLALFTSYRAMDDAATAVRARLGYPVLTQRDLPKPRLVERFSAEPETCLFATMGFWQGVDVPGESLSLVVIDRLPFPRPDEPLLQARRELAGVDAFDTIDLPRAATLLAQGSGRLIRSASDRGVVAVLDPRLATARYRWDIIRALPPMRRTKEFSDVAAFLQASREPTAPQ